MHVHGARMVASNLNLYSAVQAAKAESKEKAAEVRKKLRTMASEFAGELEDSVTLVGNNSEQEPDGQDGEEDQCANHEESSPEKPISNWA